eukprot:TRINITY_DN57570_c0_g1_i1.p1 TRINITY_DN57570_c0_g1~~TRINITY_DN57570_c0_g1_i1.p1  ORF type:complete len:420 (-),score=78.83 TRINITY_DN57570_c0_g1_i1:124-1383(-)
MSEGERPCSAVRDSSAAVVSCSSHVRVRFDIVENIADAVRFSTSSTAPHQQEASAASTATEPGDLPPLPLNPAVWAAEYHFSDSEDPERTALYVICLDAINFCFWPDPEWEYDTIARALKRAFLERPDAVTPAALAVMSPSALRSLLRASPPLLAARAAALREVGTGLLRDFDGSAAAFVRAAGGSAERLVALVLRTFPMFRDATVFPVAAPLATTTTEPGFFSPTGPSGLPAPFAEPAARLLGTMDDGASAVVAPALVHAHLYKRAQILAADMWGAFAGEGLGAFGDVERLTMFADYRVPQTLRHLGILEVAPALAAAIEAGEVLSTGGAAEVALRAASIVAVEALVAALRKREPAAPSPSTGSASTGRAGEDVGSTKVEGTRRMRVCAVVVDWWLWEYGEAHRRALPPFHRTLSCFY